MRKTRFLLIFSTILLLLFALLLAGCSADEPPVSEPPAEDPVTEEPPAEDTPAEEQPPEKDPLVIEQGEITVSDYWKNDPVAVNPRPERAQGTPLCFEQIVTVRANGGAGFQIADDLTEAAAIIEASLWDDRKLENSTFAAVCGAVSRVDFSQFRLLVFVSQYGSGNLVNHNQLEGLLHDGRGGLTRMMLATPYSGDLTDDIAYGARFVLVRRSDYTATAEEATSKACWYRPYPSPIEQGTVTVSEYWEDAEGAANPCPNDVIGTSIPFEELGRYRVYESFFRDGTETVRCAGDLEAAAYLICDYAYEYSGEGFSEMREKASHIDFSQFYLLVLVERYDNIYHPFPFESKALIYDGQGGLTLVQYRLTEQYNIYDDKDIFARFVLVRRTDLGAAEELHFAMHSYRDPINVITQGEIIVSDAWDTIERPLNNYKYYSDGDTLQFEQLGLVAVEYGGNNKISFADSLTEAAALIDSLTTYNSAGCLALNEIASHVDFSQFRLMFIEETWSAPERLEYCYLDTLIRDRNSICTVYNYYDNNGAGAGSAKERYVRVLLIHTSHLSSEYDDMHCCRHN